VIIAVNVYTNLATHHSLGNQVLRLMSTFGTKILHETITILKQPSTEPQVA
jgi:hypothetical protein